MLSGIVHYEAFFLAALLFAMTPGLDTVFVLNKAVCSGRRSALITSCGVNCGILVHTVIGAVGLSAVLAASTAAFTAVKFAGAAYLVWLGLKAIFTKSSLALDSQALFREESAWTSFRTGLMTNVLNPKVALFVLAFFPQFIDASVVGSTAPFLVLGVSYAAVGLAWYLPMAWMAGSLGRLIARNKSVGKWLGKASGVVFILLGVKIAASDGAAA